MTDRIVFDDTDDTDDTSPNAGQDGNDLLIVNNGDGSDFLEVEAAGLDVVVAAATTETADATIDEAIISGNRADGPPPTASAEGDDTLLGDMNDSFSFAPADRESQVMADGAVIFITDSVEAGDAFDDTDIVHVIADDYQAPMLEADAMGFDSVFDAG